MTVRISEEVQARESEVSHLIEEYSELADLDPNLVRALITQESRFIADAVSPTNAYGYGQFTNIGARQIQEIAKIHNRSLFGDLDNFQKKDASDPDKGIKAVCAFLWWLFYVKYRNVEDKQVKLEASLTFYNGGGRPAALVVKHGGFSNAVPYIKQLPIQQRAQTEKFAGEVSLWYVAWHDLMKERDRASSKFTEPDTVGVVSEGNPFDSHGTSGRSLDHRYRALVEALKLVGDDEQVDVIVNSRDGLTEVTLVLPGEYTLVRN